MRRGTDRQTYAQTYIFHNFILVDQGLTVSEACRRNFHQVSDPEHRELEAVNFLTHTCDFSTTVVLLRKCASDDRLSVRLSHRRTFIVRQNGPAVERLEPVFDSELRLRLATARVPQTASVWSPKIEIRTRRDLSATAAASYTLQRETVTDVRCRLVTEMVSDEDNAATIDRVSNTVSRALSV